MVINDCDKRILRDMAKKVKEYSQHPSELDKIKLWYNHNDLKGSRPVLFCDPENGWNEIIRQDDLLCENPVARGYEFELHKRIIHAEKICDDMVISDEINVGLVATESDWGLLVNKYGGENGGSYHWDPPLTDYSLLDKIRYPEITVDNKASIELFELTQDIFQGILNVNLYHSWWWTLGLTWTLVDLRGLEQIMLDMYDNENELHTLMGKLRDGTLRKLSYLEKNNLLFSNAGNRYVGSGGFGFTSVLPEKKTCSLNEMWGFAESQETVGVSAEMFAEFILPYQLPILEKFGLNCYGCCEPLEKRWDYVKTIPRLRRVSVSPWADINKMSELLGKDYIFSYKPNPAYLAASLLDEAFLRNHIRELVKNTKDNHLEIIIKDNHTLHNNPENLYRFAQIIREETM